MSIQLNAVFVPTGQFYGVKYPEVRLTGMDILDVVVVTGALSDGSILQVATLKGIQYSIVADLSLAAGPYVDLVWTAYDSNGTLVDTLNKRVPIIPSNYKVHIVFDEAVTDVSGNVLVPANTEYVYMTDLSPFYVPIDYFRANTYTLFDDFTDIQLAEILQNASAEAEAETFCSIETTDSRYPYLKYSQASYVLMKALSDYIKYLIATQANKSKKLADLQIELGRVGRGATIIQDWFKDMNDLRKVLNSCGEVSAGASVKPQVGRIADAYDRSVFGRYISGTIYPMQTQMGVGATSMGPAWAAQGNYGVRYMDVWGQASLYYMIPPSTNHLFTDPYSAYWLK